MPHSDIRPLFTILTATFNRAHTLTRLYDSIAAQDFRDFEWVVVDDGSTDDTEDLISRFAREAEFPVRYFRQAHGHKKAAYNYGVREARGELMVCWDSDDAALPNALSVLHQEWLAIPEADRDAYVGITGLCAYEDGTIFGDSYPTSPYDSNPIASTFCDEISGDKSGFQRVAVLREYPFPEFIVGLVPEGVVWNAIARKYKTRYINRPILTYHVEQDSIINSRNTLMKTRSMAQGRCYYTADFLTHDWRWATQAPLDVLKIAANNTRYAWHMWRNGRGAGFLPRSFPGWMLKIFAWPVGFTAFLYEELRLPRN
jgi:glycosyltransferase involved in cell wall biosynthesis